MRSEREFDYCVFDHLEPQEFVDLCNALLLREISRQVIPFGAKGPDGGRDAVFQGKSDILDIEGFWVFQNKFHKIREQGIGKARSRVKSELKKELRGVLELYGSQVQIFVFITNVPFTALMNEWVYQDIVPRYRNTGLKYVEVWDGYKVFLFVQGYQDLYDRYVRDRVGAIEEGVRRVESKVTGVFSDPFQIREVERLIWSIAEKRRQAEDWKQLHEECQEISLKLVILRGVVSANDLDTSVHDLEHHWSWECSFSIRSFIDLDRLADSAVKREFVGINKTGRWLEKLQIATERMDKIVDQCARPADLLLDQAMSVLSDLEKAVGELLKMLDTRLRRSIGELERDVLRVKAGLQIPEG